jgi:hypothetical protein
VKTRGDNFMPAQLSEIVRNVISFNGKMKRYQVKRKLKDNLYKERLNCHLKGSRKGKVKLV